MGEKMDDLKGRAKEAAGDLTDNEGLEREGKVDQGKAEVKEKVGNATDKIGDKLKDITN
ncbi:MAG TPA: CsbD family protein [Acidimicrobiales bacterium]|nr:CsbD family protein [Acidimicrobiales bacterium]